MIGAMAKKQGWYKRIELGESLGRLLVEHLSGMATKDVGDKLKAIGVWAA